MNNTTAIYYMGLPIVDLLAGLMLELDMHQYGPLPAGPKIFAPNHPSTTDPFLILKATNEQMSILIDDRLFKIPIFGDYLHEAGHIPVIPGRGCEAFDTALDRLLDGQNITIFPEGQISPLKGGLHPARTGAARLALLSGAPIIPVGIALDRQRVRQIDTRIEGKSATGTWYLRGPYAMTIGRPLHIKGDITDHPFVRGSSMQIMHHICKLAQESNIRMYRSARRKSLLAAVKSGKWAISG